MTNFPDQVESDSSVNPQLESLRQEMNRLTRLLLDGCYELEYADPQDVHYWRLIPEPPILGLYQIECQEEN